MTSDAKIGLLLGLIFIFIIAFLINGLPDFHRDVNNNELTTNMVSSQNNPAALAANERKVSREVANYIEPVKETASADAAGETSQNNPNAYFTMPLPQASSIAEKTEDDNKPGAPLPPSPIVEKTDTPKAEPGKTTAQKIYIVQMGDVLANIAKKCYGPVEGSRKINIDRIFEANAGTLTSPDEIYEGQKLVIPPPIVSTSGKSKLDGIFPATMFKKVESVGGSRLLTDTQQAGQSGKYTVREGDSLWQIASEQLGNGNRYGEIAKLNADILNSEDNLAVGMRLKMPAR